MTTRNKVIGLALVMAGSWLLTGLLITPSAPERRDHFDENFTTPGLTIVLPPEEHKSPAAVIDTGVIDRTPSAPEQTSPHAVSVSDVTKRAL